jgi:hypothetical protein
MTTPKLTASSPKQTDAREIEAVQHRFTKRLPGLATFNFCTRLAILEFDSLELRRLHIGPCAYIKS